MMQRRADLKYIKDEHGRLTPPVYPTPEPDIYGALQAQLQVLNQILGALAENGGSSETPHVSTEAKNLRIAVVPLGAANTETRYQFSVGTKTFVMHTRNGNEVRMATEPGIVSADPATESKDPRFTLKANTVYSQDDLNVTDFSQTFYFACSVADEVLEIIIGV